MKMQIKLSSPDGATGGEPCSFAGQSEAWKSCYWFLKAANIKAKEWSVLVFPALTVLRCGQTAVTKRQVKFSGRTTSSSKAGPGLSTRVQVLGVCVSNVAVCVYSNTTMLCFCRRRPEWSQWIQVLHLWQRPGRLVQQLRQKIPGGTSGTTSVTLQTLTGFIWGADGTLFAVGVSWSSWKGHDYSLKSISMKIRPVQ